VMLNKEAFSNWRKVAGVTLIELMMSVAILGVLTLIVMTVFSVGVESWMTGTALAEESHNADAVMEQVIMALKSAYYPEASEPSYEYGFMHEDGGESPRAEDKISWVKVGNSLIGEDTPWAGAAHRVELFIGNGSTGEEHGLYVKAWQLVGQDDEFDPEKDVEPLLISDQVASFDCLMKDPSKKESLGEPYEWIDEWSESNKLPTHVMITIAMKPLKEKDEPMEYVRCLEIPMADMSWNPMRTGGREQGGGGRGRTGRGRGGQIEGAGVARPSGAGSRGGGSGSIARPEDRRGSRSDGQRRTDNFRRDGQGGEGGFRRNRQGEGNRRGQRRGGDGSRGDFRRDERGGRGDSGGSQRRPMIMSF
jgi:prepilin-type N-terminal cleavage/methylation domain-containing protein